jgi:hypothetical protein
LEPRKAFGIVATVGCLASFVAWSGCGSSVSDASGGGMTCSPGATRTCVGPGACEGGQQCSADGTVWGDCACGSTNASSSSSTSASSASSGAGGQGGQGGAGGGFIDGELDPQWTPAWSSILGYWKLDEAEGASTLADSSGHGNTAKPMGNVHLGQPGELGNAAAFDGSTGYIVTPLNPVLASYTLAAWINPSAPVSAVGHEMRIFSNGSYGFLNGAVDWGLSAQGGGQLFILNQDPSGQDVYRALNPNSIGDGTWTHVAVVYSDGDHTTALYVNGQAVTGGFDAGGTMRTPSANSAFAFHIGASGNALQFFSGSIDDVAIWSTNLAAGDVATIYLHQQAAHGP